jgi:hypothetical protein
MTTKFFAAAPDGSIHTRTSKTRQYTHTVLARHNYAHDLALADSIRAVDANNFRYYFALAAGTHEHLRPVAWRTAEQNEAERARSMAQAVEQMRGCQTAVEYQLAQRADRLARLAECKADGYYDQWVDLGWCGRLDLAHKLVASKRGYYTDITVVEAQTKA